MTLNLTLYIWRQAGPDKKGAFRRYEARGISKDMSFLEMLDVINQGLIEKGDEPIVFQHDCREGICGSCGLMINGKAHGPVKNTTTCELYMRHFSDGQTIYIEPWRSVAFPVLKDLIVDRSALDRIIKAGGFISVSTGEAREANATLIPKTTAEQAMDAAECIGCGACVAACPNGSAMLFTSAKVSHLGLLPQGQPERFTRALSMTTQMDSEGFGGCTNHGECQEACPKGISISFITRMYRDFVISELKKLTGSTCKMRAQ